jgi:hypothetical protein
MTGLTKESLIEMLITTPSNDMEIGFNAGIIHILKKIVALAGGSGEELDPLDLASLGKSGQLHSKNYLEFKQAMKATWGSENLMYKFTPADIKSIVSLVRGGQKLQAVKDIKALSDMGLKECKDLVDSL